MPPFQSGRLSEVAIRSFLHLVSQFSSKTRLVGRGALETTRFAKQKLSTNETHMKQIRLILLAALCLLAAVFAERTSAQSDDDVIIDIDWGNSLPAPAQMATPANGTVLTSSTVVFQWSAGNLVGQYWLRIGSTPGGRDLVEQSMGLATSVSVTRLPINGKAIYVTLFSFVQGQWQYFSYVYPTSVSGATARMISPVDGSTLTSSTVVFQWTPVATAQQYWLFIGTSREGYNLLSQSAGLYTSFEIRNLPQNGQPIFVKLWTLINGQWLANSYQYITATANITQGLSYEGFETADYLTSVAQIDALTPVRHGQVPNFDSSVRSREEKYAIRFTGLIYVSTTGSYKFFSDSDDGSRLLIDRKLVVDNDGAHGSQEKSGEVELGAGYHEISLTYFQTYGGQNLVVSWAGPGFAQQRIPNERLFHR